MPAESPDALMKKLQDAVQEKGDGLAHCIVQAPTGQIRPFLTQTSGSSMQLASALLAVSPACLSSMNSALGLLACA